MPLPALQFASSAVEAEFGIFLGNTGGSEVQKNAQLAGGAWYPKSRVSGLDHERAESRTRPAGRQDRFNLGAARALNCDVNYPFLSFLRETGNSPESGNP